MSVEPASPPEGGQGAAPVSPPAAPPVESPPSPPAAPPPPFYADWKNPEIRGFAEKKNFPDAETLASSYMNLEKFHGVPADRLLKLPENLTDPEALKPVLERIGYVAPKEAKDYGFADMEGADPAFAEVAQGWAHEIGLPPQFAKPMAERWNKYMAEQKVSVLREAEEEVGVELGQLRGEWAGKYDEKVEKARRAIRHLGFSQEELEALETSTGAGNLYRRFEAAFDKLGIGESNFVQGEARKGFDMTPDAARAELTRLQADREFGARLLNKDAGALERWNRLNQILASGVQS